MRKRLAAIAHIQSGPLPGVAWLQGMFVKSGQDAVAARYRGEMASVIRSGQVEQYEVAGSAARIDRPFGLEPYTHMPPQMVATAQSFVVRGFARISTLRCNPDWTLVESPFGIIGSDQSFLDEWLGVPMLQLWSGRFVSPLPEQDTEDDPAEMTGFSYHADGTFKRWVEFERNIHDGTRFTIRGNPQPFERPGHYEAKRTRDRMTRAILFEILGNLDIDPMAVFGRRELDNPLLYTSEIPGQSCAVYEAERRRYDDMVNRPPPFDMKPILVWGPDAGF